MKKGDFVKIAVLGRIVNAKILDFSDKWVKVVFEAITYKTSINNIQK